MVVFWNEAAERLYGYEADEMIGREIAVLIPPDRPNELSNLLARAQSGETVRNLQTERLRKDGTTVAVSITVSPVIGPDGTVLGMSKLINQHVVKAIVNLAQGFGCETIAEGVEDG